MNIYPREVHVIWVLNAILPRSDPT